VFILDLNFDVWVRFVGQVLIGVLPRYFFLNLAENHLSAVILIEIRRRRLHFQRGQAFRRYRRILVFFFNNFAGWRLLHFRPLFEFLIMLFLIYMLFLCVSLLSFQSFLRLFGVDFVDS
jgi:hypothetical protein